MNNKAILFLKKFAYTFLLNLIALFTSVLTVLIVPKLIGIEEYGYWQLYIFYTAYVGFMHLGWNDGIYLRFGGEKYKSLNRRIFTSQFYLLIISQILLAFFLFGVIDWFIEDGSKYFVLKMTLLCMAIVNVRQMLLSILQGTNKIEKAANVLVIGKILYLIFLVMFLILGVRDFKLFIIVDLIGKIFSLALAILYCRDIVFGKIINLTIAFKEMLTNISIGSKLMFANIASLLIIGTVRLGIERSWDVATFGKISLVLSLSNLMMIFVNAIGIIIYPLLKRLDREMYSSIFKTLKTTLTVSLLGLLLIFYPFKLLIGEWLPQYSESLNYMALLFPLIFFEGKIALLIITYLNALRKEKLMLKINILLFILSMVSTIITTVIFNNLTLSVISILILVALRGIIAEAFLSRILEVNFYLDMLLQSVVVILFVLINWNVNSWYSFLLYLIVYCIYLYVRKREISSTISELKNLVLSKPHTS